MTNAVHITVMRDKRVASWPKYPRGRRCRSVPLGWALRSTWANDVHFTAYSTPNGRRLSKAAVGRLPIELGVLVLDVDCAEVHGSSQPAPDGWRQDFAERFDAMQADHSGGFAYGTRGGGRIVYRIAPYRVATQADAQRWRKEYAVICAYVLDRYGIEADIACGDWTRLYRLPHVRREPGAPHEKWPIHGDSEAIGTLLIKPSVAHLDRAKELCPKAFTLPRRTFHVDPSSRAKSVRSAKRAVRPSTGDHRGALYLALQARGDVLADHELGWVVRCPNAQQHSSGSDGDGSTVLRPPGGGQSLGWVQCLHAHCQGLTIDDWLELSGCEQTRRAS